MSAFKEQVNRLSRAQLLELSISLQDELLNLRPDEFQPRFFPADLVHRTVWRPSSWKNSEQARRVVKRLLILAHDASSSAQPFQALARRRGVETTCVLLEASESFEPIERQLQGLRATLGSFDALVYCPPALSGSDNPARIKDLWATALSLSALIASLGPEIGVRLWFVTHLAQPVTASDRDLNFCQAALSGLGKSLSLECPQRWGACIDLDGAPDSLQHVIDEIEAGDDDEVAYRGATRYLPVLERAELAQPGARSAIRTDATYLVTGGMGGIGSLLVEHLLAQGAASIAIVSRHDEAFFRQASQMHSAELSTLQRWRASYPSARVALLKADVADRAALARVLEGLKDQPLPVKGVFHLAGANELVRLSDIRRETVDRIVTAKALGSLHLHELTRHLQMDFQVYFSSIAGSWGTASMAPYALANRFLDAFSHYRNGQGYATHSIAWGPWADVGMIVKQKQSFAVLGLRLIEPRDGLHILDRVLACDLAQVTAAHVDWSKYAAVLEHARHLRPFQALCDAADRLSKASPASASAAAEDFSDPEQMGAFLRGLVAELLSEELPKNCEDRPLQELGFSSLLGVELSQRIKQRLRIACRPTVIFDFPTLRSLTEELTRQWSAAHRPPIAALPSRSAEEHREQAIAIIGMACTLPGASSSLELWDLLAGAGQSGRDVIQHAPAHRFDLRRYLSSKDEPGKAYTLSGGYIEDIAAFDHDLFHISRREAQLMDPQQRLALETTWRAFEHARLDPAAKQSTAEQQVGVFFGIGQNEYGALCRSLLDDEHAGLMSTGQSMNIIAGRIAYHYGFHGPAIAFDTACSSALVALDAAVRYLRNGNGRLAVVGGVNALISPDTFVLLSKARALSRRGRCAAFDSEADGYVRSEGCVVLLLRSLEEARAEGNAVHAVIRGCAVNQDGRSSGLTAPSGRAQERVIRAALQDAGVEARQIDIVEAHGTGTPLGDPIEYHALKAVYTDGVARRAPLLLSSIKSLIGHSEAASGLAGLMKLALCMQKRELPAQVNYLQLNPYIESSDQILIPKESQRLAADGEVFGAVSAFGFSGTNAHVIVQGGVEPFGHQETRQPANRIHCWYTPHPLSESTGLAQAFAGVSLDPEQKRELQGCPQFYAKRWEPRADSASGVGANVTRVLLVRVLSEAGDLPHSYEIVKESFSSRGIALLEVEPQALSQAALGFDHIVACLDFPREPVLETRPESALDGARVEYGMLLRVLKPLAALPSASRAEAARRLLILTAGDGFKGDADSCLAAVLATFHHEHPEFNPTLVHLAERIEAERLAQHLHEALRASEPVLLLSRQGVCVPRLERIHPHDGTVRFPGDRAFVVTGGLGGLGSTVIEWLLSRGARTVVSLSRRSLSVEQAAHFTRLSERYSAEVRHAPVDIADRDSVAASLHSISAEGMPLAGVFHCAGAIDDCPIERESWSKTREIVLPKLVGAWNLHLATLDAPLEYFVMFSSVSSLLGNTHQAGYCFANGLLDRLAAHRRAMRKPALAINWGPWSELGMVGRKQGELSAQYRQLGLALFPAKAYLEALSRILARGSGDPDLSAQLGIFALDWRRYQDARGVSPLYSQLSVAAAENADPQPPALADILAPLDPQRRARKLRQFLRSMVADCLSVDDPSAISDTQGFTELGITSLHSAILHRKLERALRAKVVPTVSFDYPNVGALAEFLAADYLREFFPAPEARAERPSGDALASCSEAELIGVLNREVRQVSL